MFKYKSEILDSNIDLKSQFKINIKLKKLVKNKI